MDPTRTVVIGAGPVGQTTALLLARWGLPVTLLDRATHRDPVGSKSICQQRDVLDIWRHLGAHAITDEGTTWTTARTYYRDRELFTWSFAPTTGTPPFVNISQARTEAILDTLIADQELITTRWNTHVTAITPHQRGVTIHTGTETIEAAHAVICAGAHDHGLRKQLGIDFTGTSYHDRFLICDIAAKLPQRRHERHFHFDPQSNPGRQVLIHPCPDDTFRIDWQVPPEFDLDTEARNGQLDRRIIGDTPYQLLWRTVYRFHSRLADTMQTGRILLAGDCAHLTAPFGARGLNSGITDAENAAWKIAAHTHGWAPKTILSTYHTERHAAALENQAVVDATMNFLVPPDQTARQHRHATLEAARTDPQLAATIDSGRFAEPYWYQQSPLTTPEHTRPCQGRPPKGQPQPAAPGVICPDAQLPDHTSLRQQLRGTFTLITNHQTPYHNPTQAPLQHIALHQIDPTGNLADTIDLHPGETWLTRPDAHLAATLPNATQDDITTALRRALGHTM